MVTWLLHSFSLPRCVPYDLTRGVSAAQVIVLTFCHQHGMLLIRYRALEKLTEICCDQPIKSSLRALSASLGDANGSRSMICKAEGARRRIGTTRTPFLQACIHCSLSWLNPTNASTHLDAHTYCAATGKRPNGVLPS